MTLALQREGESVLLANLADSGLETEDFREGLKPVRGNAREVSMI